MIFPLDLDGKIYVLQDETGKTVGTGTRKVCEALMSLISKSTSTVSDRSCSQISHRPNVRAAKGI
jgi:hypothetical protein